jgi:hypothetical protein
LTLRLRRRLGPIRGTGFALDENSVPGHGPLNDRRELPPVILDLRLEHRDAGFSGAKHHAIAF